MKLKRETPIFYLKKIFPRYFWIECDVCHKEFKKEYGWKYRKYWTDRIEYKHICNECAPTEQEAIEIGERYRFIDNAREYKQMTSQYTLPPIPPKPRD